MCRMLAARASGPGLRVVSSLASLLPRAASRDPYLEAIAGDGRHCHGYGYVAALKVGGSWRVIYERFDAHPDLPGEEACEANLKALSEAVERLSGILEVADEAALILHSRRTRAEPRGITGAHPFREEVVVNIEGSEVLAEVYLAHNGGVNKESLAGELGLKSLAKTYTDSHIVLKKLAASLRGSRWDEVVERIASRVREVLPHVKSALDLLVMVNAPGSEPIVAAVGYVADPSDRDRWEYYKPIVVSGEGYSAYISSTLWDLAQEEGIPVRDYRVIQGEIAVLRPGVAAFHPISG